MTSRGASIQQELHPDAGGSEAKESLAHSATQAGKFLSKEVRHKAAGVCRYVTIGFSNANACWFAIHKPAANHSTHAACRCQLRVLLVHKPAVAVAAGASLWLSMSDMFTV